MQKLIFLNAFFSRKKLTFLTISFYSRKILFFNNLINFFILVIIIFKAKSMNELFLRNIVFLIIIFIQNSDSTKKYLLPKVQNANSD